jgi:hypothetical protein
MSEKFKFYVVCAYAAGMAWVESAVVYYLRTMIDRIEPYQPLPLPEVGGLGPAELIREAATLLMLLTVGILAGKTWRARWGYAAIAFGVWDILYYAFLKVMCDWPKSILDWDILFLIPLPWWGPVLSPVLIAGLMILWGTVVTQRENVYRTPSWLPWSLWVAGILLALYVFMADSIHLEHRGVESLRRLLPTQFNWWLFIPALMLMAAPLFPSLPVRRILSAGCSDLSYNGRENDANRI